jgi:hypothetical protein
MAVCFWTCLVDRLFVNMPYIFIQYYSYFEIFLFKYCLSSLAKWMCLSHKLHLLVIYN